MLSGVLCDWHYYCNVHATATKLQCKREHNHPSISGATINDNYYNTHYRTSFDNQFGNSANVA